MNIVVNGTFDVLHVGHLRLLSYAKQLGLKESRTPVLTVLIDADERVKQLKGNDRPINPASERIEMLMSLRAVDVVVEFDSDEQLAATIKRLSPDIMVKGSDYRGKPIIGAEYCKRIEFYERTPHSSTQKIEDIAARRNLR
jgi:D-beta-D-heptose 7-phosphate kinase/D-beta-D-heptose 1-phosphate adenosyltransferase